MTRVEPVDQFSPYAACRGLLAARATPAKEPAVVRLRRSYHRGSRVVAVRDRETDSLAQGASYSAFCAGTGWPGECGRVSPVDQDDRGCGKFKRALEIEM
jgi:hypothetical protein